MQLASLTPTKVQEAVSVELHAILEKEKQACLLGVTGSGKTVVMSRVIEKLQLPTLVIAHNKTLAAQLYHEFQTLFPNNAVEYFVSYYDYYKPEAYVPSKDLYIDKESQRNEQIEQLRHSATGALMTRSDVIVVASVSALYGLGSPVNYKKASLILEAESKRARNSIIQALVSRQYLRNDEVLKPGGFRVRGDRLDLWPPGHRTALSLEWWGDEIENIRSLDPVSGERGPAMSRIVVFPATHYAIGSSEKALKVIEGQRDTQAANFFKENRLIEAQRIRERVNYDLESLRELGSCQGIENYAPTLEGRPPGTRPWCLMDYFPEDFLVITDESHQTLPQIGGIARGDRSRKQTLIDWGFRLPGSLDNRPQTWEEFINNTPKLLALSATPGKWEEENTSIVELLVRPTAIVDPSIATYSSEGQMQKLLEEIEKEISKNRRTLVTTLTKKMAERLSEYLIENGIKTTYLHSDILTLERLAILHKLRSGEIDVLVGVNLLREGLDLPEVGMVAILDADREGFLRGKSALIQTMGRAARNPEGRVLLFSEGQSGSMKAAIEEAERRRNLQLKYNKATGQTPQAIVKPLSVASELQEVFKKDGKSEPIIEEPILNNKIALEKAMLEAADELRFEEAGLLKKRLDKLIKSGN